MIEDEKNLETLNSFLKFCKKNKDELKLTDVDITFIDNVLSDNGHVEYSYLPTLFYKINSLNDLRKKNYFISEFKDVLNLRNKELTKYFEGIEKINEHSESIEIFAPIILFVYNRIDTLQLTLNSLLANKESSESSLIVYSDGPKDKDDEIKVNQVREYVKNIKGFKNNELVIKENNNGLAKSIISGIDEVSDNYEQFIVLEDDLICSPYFLHFMNSSLNEFKNFQKVWTINGMSCDPKILNLDPELGIDYYFTRRASSHGWGSWSNRWKSIEWDTSKLISESHKLLNKRKLKQAGSDIFRMLDEQKANAIDSWAIRWVVNIAMNDGLCLTPFYSHTSHQFSVSGTHINKRKKILENNLSKAKQIRKYNMKIKLSKKINNTYTKIVHKK